MLTDDAREIVG